MIFVFLILTLTITTVFSQSLTVTHPLKGAKLTAGTRTTVKWTSTGLSATSLLKLEVWDDIPFLPDKKVASFTVKNSGSFTILVPYIDETDSSFYFKIVSSTDSGVKDESERFELFVPNYKLDVTAPTSGAELRAGEAVTIRWQTQNIPASEKLKIVFKKRKDTFDRWISFENDIEIGVVTSSTLNDGSFQWNLPLSVEAGDNYHFQVSWVANELEANSGLCKVLAATKKIDVILPRQGSIWHLIGTQKSVEIQSHGFTQDAKFDVELYSYSGSKTNLIGKIASEKVGPRIYVSLPDSTKPGLYKVRVVSMASSSIFADSVK